MLNFFEKIKFNIRSKVFIIYLIITFLMLSVLGVVVFCFWFRFPYFYISGGGVLFSLLVLVGFFSGPICTLITLDDKKSKKEFIFDLFVILMIQFSALSYGVYSISHARPIALVFEVDRLHLITYADIDPRDINELPEWVSPISLEPVRLLGIRGAETEADRISMMDLAMEGIEPGQKPSWWRTYEQSRLQVLKNAGNMTDLLNAHAEKEFDINLGAISASQGALAGETKNASDLLWLPIVGRKSADWIAFIDPVTARIRGFVSL